MSRTLRIPLAATLIAALSTATVLVPQAAYAANLPGLQYLVAETEFTSSVYKSIDLYCPVGQRVVGGGFSLIGAQGSVVLDDFIPTTDHLTVGAGEIVGPGEPADGTTANWKVHADPDLRRRVRQRLTAPTPILVPRDSRCRPAEEEQQQVRADYQGINETPGVTSGLPMGLPGNATTVRVEGGRTLTTDGPFVGMKEAVGGWFILEADDLDAAIEVAARVPAARYGGSRPKRSGSSNAS